MNIIFEYERDGKLYSFNLSRISKLLIPFDDDHICSLIDEIIDEQIAAHQEVISMSEEKVTAEKIIEMIMNGYLPSMDILLKNKIREKKRKSKRQDSYY